MFYLYLSLIIFIIFYLSGAIDIGLLLIALIWILPLLTGLIYRYFENKCKKEWKIDD